MADPRPQIWRWTVDLDTGEVFLSAREVVAWLRDIGAEDSADYLAGIESGALEETVLGDDPPRGFHGETQT